eukprot:UN04563
MVFEYFSPSGRLTKCAKFASSSFRAFKGFVYFSLSDRLTNSTKLNRFKLFNF